MKVRIPFPRIFVNQVRDKLEIVFPYRDKWYRLDWEKVPNKFKELYIAKLRLNGFPIPDRLKEYSISVINIEDLEIEIDLDECEEYEVR